MTKTAVLIDGSNLYATAQALHFNIDYLKLYELLEREYDLLRVYYFTALTPRHVPSNVHKLVTWMRASNKYTVVSKETKEFIDPDTQVVKIKGNMDLDMAAMCVELMVNRATDHIVMFTGDGDFLPIVQILQKNGIKVTVVSTIRTTQHMIASELRGQADEFCDLSHMRERIKRIRSD